MAMASKSLLLAAVFLVGLAAHGAEAQLLGLLSGIVPCSNGTDINVAMSPVFPNAGVQLMCNGKTVDSTTTNSKGVFTMPMSLSMTLISALMDDSCQVVVKTPLANCNGMFSTLGMLEAPVQLIEGLISLIIGGIIHLAPQSFSFNQ